MAIVSAKKSRGRPSADTEAVNVRMTREILARVDAWIADQADKPSRPEAIRRLVERGLPRTVEVAVSDEAHSWGGDAVMTQPKPRKLK